MCTLLISCTHKEIFLKRSYLILRVVKKTVTQILRHLKLEKATIFNDYRGQRTHRIDCFMENWPLILCYISIVDTEYKFRNYTYSFETRFCSFNSSCKLKIFGSNKTAFNFCKMFYSVRSQFYICSHFISRKIKEMAGQV